VTEGPAAKASVTAVVLAYGPEPLLFRCVLALLSSSGVHLDVVVVDNGCTSGAVDGLRDLSRVQVVTPACNLGFTGGCNIGATRGAGDVFVFVNSDAVVEKQAVAALVAALAQPGVGIASGSLRLMDRPEVMNSADNPVHFLGLSWAGGLGLPASSYDRARPVASATGAVMALHRTTWEALGGLCEPLFAYCEDMELSLRCWQRGWAVEYVPDAVVLHAYEFHRNPSKMFLLERNRLFVLLTVYEARTLWLLTPALLGLEVAVLGAAVAQGWSRQKVRGWWWLVEHRRELGARRAAVQCARTVPDADIAGLLTARFEPGDLTGFRAPAPLTLVSTAYWWLVRRLLTPSTAPAEVAGRPESHLGASTS
jgi:GT2 family glycosyltransferase